MSGGGGTGVLVGSGPSRAPPVPPPAARRPGCKHVNLVTHTNVVGELEFLFAAYSAFTVVSVEWAARPDDETPHVVVLQAAIDNRREAEDAPLAPWY